MVDEKQKDRGIGRIMNIYLSGVVVSIVLSALLVLCAKNFILLSKEAEADIILFMGSLSWAGVIGAMGGLVMLFPFFVCRWWSDHLCKEYEENGLN